MQTCGIFLSEPDISFHITSSSSTHVAANEIFHLHSLPRWLPTVRAEPGWREKPGISFRSPNSRKLDQRWGSHKNADITGNVFTCYQTPALIPFLLRWTLSGWKCWLNWRMLHLQVLTTTGGTVSCPGCSTSNLAHCLRPRKAAEDVPTPWDPTLHGISGRSAWLQIGLAAVVAAIWEVSW